MTFPEQNHFQGQAVLKNWGAFATHKSKKYLGLENVIFNFLTFLVPKSAIYFEK